MSVLDLYKCRMPDQDIIDRIKSSRFLQVMIGTACSQKCGYCVSDMHKTARAPGLMDTDPDMYIAALERHLNEGVILNIGAAGEPMQSPHFERVARLGLERAKAVVVPTNLHYARKLVGLTGVRVQSSYHLGAYLDQANGAELRQRWLHEWLPAAAAVAASLSVITPMTPAALDVYMEDVEHMRAYGAVLCPVELYHVYKGRSYPAAYTREQRERLSEIQQAVGYSPAKHGMPGLDREPFSAEVLPLLTNDLRLRGAPCYIRAYGAQVEPDGAVVACQAIPPIQLGRIDTIDHIFLDEPIACPADVCCCKAAGHSASLAIYGITLREYYREHYADDPNKARCFS